MGWRAVVAAFAVAIAACSPQPRPAKQQAATTVACGAERWAVKTGTDRDAGLVDVAHAVHASIGALASMPPPAELSDDSRVRPIETTVYTVDAMLVAYKRESDHDYHLVLRSTQGRTIIAEIPAPACVGAGSPFAAGIRKARAAFDARLAATTRFKRVAIPVRVTGVGFFDFDHRQRGVAPNAIELHPVVDIAFGP